MMYCVLSVILNLNNDATAIARSYPTQIHLFPGVWEASLEMFSS